MKTKNKILMSIISLLSFFYSPIIILYRSFRNHNTGEVFVSKKDMSAIENSQDRETLLNELYDIK